MIGADGADSKRGERKVEAEDSVRTVECLRGRLLAERVASRNAKEAAEKWDNKLLELENMLKQETKSRNKAEKKLRFLTKKLESLKKSQVPDESEHSGSVDKSDDVSSQSSSGLPSSSPSSSEESKEVKGNLKFDKDSESFHQNGTESSISEARTEASAFEPESPEDTTRPSSTVSDENQENGKQRFEQEDNRGNSLAIVAVRISPEENPKKIDPLVLDGTVKEVLDTLKRAKESLQSSMMMRRRRHGGMNMIKVG